ncbi:MAG TPA: sulfur oxidation c-type cytochrome SoxX [Usitatibacter sp.]|nr:sulfur oxidation c-type cytochrome SoxX [Usitatibacter sp.]
MFIALAACADRPPRVVDRLDDPFAASGDAIRGREVFLSREGGHCVLCHAVPGEKLAGDVGPSLAGVGSRLSTAQIRLRVADMSRVNPNAAMPSFHRLENLTRVAPQYRGKPVLTAQQVEDLVAWLGTLR